MAGLDFQRGEQNSSRIFPVYRTFARLYRDEIKSRIP
jgi:hypothetical protein